LIAAFRRQVASLHPLEISSLILANQIRLFLHSIANDRHFHAASVVLPPYCLRGIDSLREQRGRESLFYPKENSRNKEDDGGMAKESQN
jgi:hypothetical protein